MFIILIENQLIPSQKVCCGCVFANQQGEPRWHHNHLGCGHAVEKNPDASGTACADQYECEMGFRLAKVTQR